MNHYLPCLARRIWARRRLGQRSALWLVGWAVLAWLSSLAFALAEPNPRQVESISLEQFLRRVLDHNETVQMRLLEVEIGRKDYKAAKGIFEPEVVASYDHVDTRRENTAEQVASLGQDLFTEQNNIYTGGLESLIPTGARVRLGYTLRDLYNNLGPRSSVYPYDRTDTNQYSAFFGLSLTQPLLKNGGPAATLGEIRLAALASDIAFQEYRRQLLLTISTAEAAYWNLYMAQEQMLFFRDSVGLAETVLRDSRTRAEVGKGSDLDVLEAESGLGMRKSHQVEARQNFYEAVNRMAALCSGSFLNSNYVVIATDQPQVRAVPISYLESALQAFELNPDYLIQRQRLLQEDVRLAFAKNQRLPQLDLKASYGLNGLGENPGQSWDDLESTDYPAWSLGFEFRIPLGGGQKTRNQLSTAKLRQQRALLGLKEIETQIANALDTAIRKVGTARESVSNFQATVTFNQSLLRSQLARLELGKVEARKVLEADEDLFKAKNSVLEASIQFQRACLELGLIEGSLLKARQMDINRRELEEATTQLFRNSSISEEDYKRYLQQVRLQYERRVPATTPASFRTTRPVPDPQPPALNPRASPAAPPAGLNPAQLDEALRLLHQEIEKPGQATPEP